jgi:hypothetical protein
MNLITGPLLNRVPRRLERNSTVSESFFSIQNPETWSSAFTPFGIRRFLSVDWHRDRDG